MSQTLYTATQTQTLTFCLCDVSNTLHSNSKTNTYLFSLWCRKHFAQQLKHKHLPFVSVMSQTLYTATQTQTLTFCLCDVSNTLHSNSNIRHLPFLSLMSQTLCTAIQIQTLTFPLCDFSNTLHNNSNIKHLPFLSLMSHTLYTATQTVPQNMTPTDQPSAPQIRHPRSPGSENWGSRCHLYPADEHNQINGNEPSLFDIISRQL